MSSNLHPFHETLQVWMSHRQEVQVRFSFTKPSVFLELKFPTKGQQNEGIGFTTSINPKIYTSQRIRHIKNIAKVT